MEQPLGFVAQRSLLDWYVIFENLYMTSSSLLEFGLESLVVLLNNLV